MKALRLTSLIVSAALVTACANESPLLFVSKSSVGLDVSTPTTGSTELSVNFGWKSIDAAYVPVVEIVDKDGRVLHQILSGDSEATRQQTPTPNPLAVKLKEEVDLLVEKSETLAKIDKTNDPAAVAELTQQEEKVTNLAEQLSLESIKSEQKPSAAPNLSRELKEQVGLLVKNTIDFRKIANQPKAAANLENQKKVVTAISEKIASPENTKIEQQPPIASTLSIQLVKASDALNETTELYKKATDIDKPQFKKQMQVQQEVVATISEALIKSIDRTDALSVFSVIDTKSVFRESVGVGKVFATGMAAQNVSRDFNSSRGCVTAISNAVAKLAASTDAAEQAKAKALIEACK
ncbi:MULTISPECIES: hypothetical protein [Pseudomonas]|uniref:hypothetical protein n=1 Tax=Pseudomonas TaxID=286 RepID=UPI0018E80273|nr:MULTISPECIES: hypothetical protein [Pseudomonas]MBJ2347685.1 hypothetical protein [Pseudomonas canavaninivorans]MBL3543667.1 hypothetical protein [Pseudomonas sp. HB05]